MSALRSSRGFTLIELFVGLLIFGLLMMLGMPSFTTFLRNSEIRSTAESLINGLRLASAEAVNQNDFVAFTLTDGAASWSVNLVTDVQTGTLQQPPIQQYATAESGRNARVTVTPAGETTVIFTGLGRVRNPATPNDHIEAIDITSIDGDGRPLRIIVDDPNPATPTTPRGLRMCDPDPALRALSPPDPRAC